MTPSASPEVLTLDANAFRARIDVSGAVDALRAAFGDLSVFSSPQRSVVSVGEADMLLMPAAGPAGAGVKLVTVNPANPAKGHPLIHAVYVLFDEERLAPVAIIDGEALTSLRTASLSALATDLCASPRARHLVIFGAGAQARAHLETIPAIRPIEKVTVVSRTREGAERLADEARWLGLEAEVGMPAAVVDADVVCACTTSPEPLFDGGVLKPGAHVNAVGAYKPDARETDDRLVRRAAVVVETREVALAEAGDIVMPLQGGVIDEEAMVELSELVTGRRSADGGDVTFFKSVGMALEDLAVAVRAVGNGGKA